MKNKRHTSHIVLYTSQKGITLIALIITIIVMLILVGVTINVALNGGLFQKAEKATKQTEEKAILEEMLAMMELTNDGKINAQVIIDKMKEKYTVGGTIPNITITGKLGIYNYIVSETEIKIGGNNVPETIDSDLKKYILGAAETGRTLLEFDEEGNMIGGIFDGDEFLDDPLTEEVNETETLGVENFAILESEDSTKIFIYVKYDNKIYRTRVNTETYSSEAPIELVYEPQGREGQTIADGWTILYDNGTTLEAVSPTAMGSLRLGYSETAEDEETQLAEAIESYNNAIININNYCKNELTGLPTNIGVRSVGALSETSDYYYSDNLAALNSTYNGVGKKGNIVYEQDLIRMVYWGVHNIGTSYWVASRKIQESDKVYFYVECVGSYGEFDYSRSLWLVDSSGSASGRYVSYAVRPIITIQN